jgi:hypothetical protein
MKATALIFPVGAWSKVHVVLNRSNTRIVRTNPAKVMDVRGPFEKFVDSLLRVGTM